MIEDVSVFDPTKVSIITTTFYSRWRPGELQWHPGELVTPEVSDKVRGDLAIQTICAGADRGVKVIVVDGTGDLPFRKASQRLDKRKISIHNEVDKGMSPSRQQGFRIAYAMPDGTAFLWTEPEKVSLVKRHEDDADCLEPLMIPIIQNLADMTIPFRNDESFATYPDYQADYEQESNRRWNDLLETEGVLPPGHARFDVWKGPRGWHRDITGLFLRKYRSTDPDARLVKPEEYFNAIFLPVITALVESKRVLSIQVPYRHPEIQKAIEQGSREFREKRKYQQESILETTREYLALLRGEPSRIVLAT